MPVLISVTRLRVRLARFLPSFLLGNERSVRQLRRAAGFRGGKQLIDRRLVFWTATCWDDSFTMRAFTMAGAHGEVMPRLPEWCDEAAVVHWEQDTDVLPSWKLAHAKLVSEGRASRVRYPSPDHPRRGFPLPRTLALERDLRPEGSQTT
jgi:hypothetical protein